MKERLKAEDLVKTKCLPDKDGKPCPAKVLDHVSMTVYEGEVFVILGPTGCGKTTLLRMLNKLEVPDSGRIFLDGADTDELDVTELRRRVGMVFQSPVVFEGSVEDDILYGRRLRDDRDMSSAAQFASTVGLSKNFINRTTKALSVGEKQKVTIARALANEPEILLMDEPTSALDPSSKLCIEKLIRDSVNMGPTVVMVTHDVEQARRLADRVLILVEGKRVAEGPRSEIFGEDAPQIVKQFLSGNLEVTDK